MPQERFYVQKFGEGVFISCGTGWPRAMAGRLGTVMGTGQAIDEHTGAGGHAQTQQKQALVLRDRNTYNWAWEAGLLGGEKRNWAAYVMPKTVGRMASMYISLVLAVQTSLKSHPNPNPLYSTVNRKMQ